MPLELIITFARQIMLSVGAAAVTAGYLTNDQLTAMVGGIIAVITVVFGLVAKNANVQKIAELKQDKAVLKQELRAAKSDDPSAPVGGMPGGY